MANNAFNHGMAHLSAGSNVANASLSQQEVQEFANSIAMANSNIGHASLSNLGVQGNSNSMANIGHASLSNLGVQENSNARSAGKLKLHGK